MKARIRYMPNICPYSHMQISSGYYQVEIKTFLFYRFVKEFSHRKDAEEFIKAIGLEAVIYE